MTTAYPAASCLDPIVLMSSGTAADAVKPKKPLAFKVTQADWLRVSVFHDVRGPRLTTPPSQDEYTSAAVIRCPNDRVEVC